MTPMNPSSIGESAMRWASTECPTRVRSVSGTGMCAVLIPMALACGETAEPSPALDLQLRDIRLTPVVAVPGEPFTLAFQIEGARGPVVIASLDPAAAARLQRHGGRLESLLLRDDGTEGDALPGDGWFTVAGLAPTDVSAEIHTESISGLSGLHEPGSGESGSIPLQISFRVVDAARVTPPAVTALGPDVQATSRVIAIAAPEWREPSEANLHAAVRRYYTLFPDDRDFLAVEFPASAGTPWAGRALHVRNSDVGIGLPVREFRDFGSPSRLQLVVQGAVSWHRSAARGTGFCLLNHELSHRWITYTGAPLEAQSHWAPGVLDRPTSVLGDSVGCVMNDLELYLAGFVPADSVLTPLTRSGYAFEDLVRTLGPRPFDPDATREFAIGFIVITEAPLPDHALAYFHRVAEEYAGMASQLGANWAVATGGRSRLDGLLPSRD
jgi:hypothetical protein